MSASSRIARYEPEELLGSVGLVDTYRARLRGEEGLVALKVLFMDRAEASVARSIADRFLAAARRAQAAKAPGIAPVLEVADEEETVFTASEFVPGFDVGRLVQLAGQRSDARGLGLPPEVAGMLCAQVARVLAAAHALAPPFHHLGLCPGNVGVTEAGQVKVLDFGHGAALRAAGSCPIEKWLFVAPELIGVDGEGIEAEKARAADLYSLGALLFFMLCGRPPVEATTLAELSDRVWEPLPEVAGVPKNLLSAMRALTAPEPSDRPESAQVVVEWLSGGASAMPEMQLAKALQALRLRPAAPPPAAPAKLPVRSLPLGGQKPAVVATAPARKGGAIASRPAPHGGRSPALVASGVLLASVLAAWAVVRRHTPARQARPADAGAPAVVAHDPERAVANRAETTRLRPPDGGLHPSPVVAVEPYRVESDAPPKRIPKHLFLDTSPSQADVWVDGVFRGKTPVDLVVGVGGHRVVVIKEGYRVLQAVFDTTQGEYARRGLQRAGFPSFGDAWLELRCEHPNRFPVVLDDEETGLLCPVDRLRVPSGKHHVGIFVPGRRNVVAVEVTASPGPVPKRVMLKE